MDTRITDWQVKAPDLAADNRAGALLAMGSELTTLQGFDPRYLGFALLNNGQVASTGVGANVLGDPLESMVWLAHELGSLGLSLKAGEVVLTSAAVPPVPVEAGDSIHLTVDRIGQVFCRFA